jgi:hypothetical protein
MVIRSRSIESLISTVIVWESGKFSIFFLVHEVK